MLGLSLITNFVVMSEDDGVEKATHEDVLKTSQLRAKEMVSLVKLIAERLPSNFRQE